MLRREGAGERVAAMNGLKNGLALCNVNGVNRTMSERDETTERHMAYLAELADMGMDIVRIAARQAKEHPEKADQLIRVVDRLTREVLKTEALRRELAKDLVQPIMTPRRRIAAQPPLGYVAPPTSRQIH
jgi:hypothetical protein